MPSFLSNVNLNQLELQNPVAQNLASAPASPKKGQFYFDSGTNTLSWWDGTTWQSAKGGVVAFAAPGNSAVGDAVAAGASTSAARSDHVHGREGFAAPTAQTAFGSASATGVALTLAHSDHTHGTPTHVDADHSAIHLNALAQPTAAVNFGGQQATNSADPSNATDLATKQYVDNARAGLSLKDPVKGASTANLAVATALINGLVHDGVTYATGNRILLKNQTTPSENGIWIIAAAGAASRATDADGSGEIVDGTAVWVQSGTVNGDQRWVASTVAATPWVPGTTSTTWTLDFAATSVTAGAGLTGAGQVLNVGAGTGIVVNADSVTVDRATNGAIVPLKYSQAVGDGAATSIVVTHNLNTQDVHVTLYAAGAPFGEVLADVQHTSVNTITLIFATAPAASAYRVVVIG